MAWLNRWAVCFEQCHPSPKLCTAAIQHFSDALSRCFIICAVKVDSANQVAASIQKVDSVMRHFTWSRSSSAAVLLCLKIQTSFAGASCAVTRRRHTRLGLIALEPIVVDRPVSSQQRVLAHLLLTHSHGFGSYVEPDAVWSALGAVGATARSV
ncbi:hypothetical protein [Bradyrhizobium sp. RDM4]|uniref:hypothetical protein n=1 Tax=Bradyrhizobium sp. RDM4 TaxID=3378765 RepID=UPI0038FCE066